MYYCRVFDMHARPGYFSLAIHIHDAFLSVSISEVAASCWPWTRFVPRDDLNDLAFTDAVTYYTCRCRYLPRFSGTAGLASLLRTGVRIHGYPLLDLYMETLEEHSLISFVLDMQGPQKFWHRVTNSPFVENLPFLYDCLRKEQWLNLVEQEDLDDVPSVSLLLCNSSLLDIS